MGTSCYTTVLLSAFVLLVCIPNISSRRVSPQNGQSQHHLLAHKMKVPCLNYDSCKLNTDFVKQAIERGDIDEACRHVTATFYCQKSATKSCEEKGWTNSNVLYAMKRAYIVIEIYMQEVCNPGYLPDDTVTRDSVQCKEFMSCFEDSDRIKVATDSQEACSIASHIYSCSQSAVTDCQRRTIKKLSPETLAYMEDALLHAWRNMDNKCAYTTTTTTIPSTHQSTKTVRCIDYAKCPVPDIDMIQLAKRTKEYKDACGAQKLYAECTDNAMRDCEQKALVSGIAMQAMKDSVIKSLKTADTFCQAYEKEQQKNQVLFDSGFFADSPGSQNRDKYSSTYPPARCADISLCPRPAYGMQRMTKGKQLENACNQMAAHSSCLERSADDCRGKDWMSHASFKSVMNAIKESKRVIQTYCGQNEGGDSKQQGNNGHTEQHYSIISIVFGSILIAKFLS